MSLPPDLFEIVSYDSVQIYRYLDIGSGKPDCEERSRIKHYCIDIADPDEDFTAGDFVRCAEDACREISEKGKIPVFVGGTGFYLDAFFQGLSGIPDISREVKESVKARLEKKGLSALYEELKLADPDFAGSIHPNDRQRVLRGLEVLEGTGSPISRFYAGRQGHESDDTFYIGLWVEREKLIEKISARVDSMISRGFIEEVENIRKMGYGPELKAMKTIGYLELNMYLDGLIDIEKAIENIKTETRRYAKRQMTWFRRNSRIKWYSPDDDITGAVLPLFEK